MPNKDLLRCWMPQKREPVVIRRQKRDVALLLSPREYERLRALNATEFQHLSPERQYESGFRASGGRWASLKH
jgi:hypothetical protein